MPDVTVPGVENEDKDDKDDKLPIGLLKAVVVPATVALIGLVVWYIKEK
jgi:hypothetical protein